MYNIFKGSYASEIQCIGIRSHWNDMKYFFPAADNQVQEYILDGSFKSRRVIHCDLKESIMACFEFSATKKMSLLKLAFVWKAREGTDLIPICIFHKTVH